MEKVDLRYNTPSNWTMFGPRISQERAHIILPMLIERATEGQTITFGELAKEFNIAWAMPIRPSIICITGTLYLLERNQLPEAQFTWTHGRIPRIANMVTKSKGEPTDWIRKQLEKIEDFQPLLDAIFAYDKWDEVLKALGIR